MRETGKEDQKKKIKTDSGQVISNKKNRKNLYPSNKKLLCVLLSMTLFSTPMTILSCTVKMLYHLTTCRSDMSVMRSEGKNTRLMIQDLDQMEKQAEEAGSQQEVGRHQNE